MAFFPFQAANRRFTPSRRNAPAVLQRAGSVWAGAAVLVGLLTLAMEGRADQRTFLYPDGKLQAQWETALSEAGDPVRHGPFLRFYPNGRLALEAFYRRGTPVGTWSWWDEEGILIQRVRRGGEEEELLAGERFNSAVTAFRNPKGNKTAEGRMKFDKGHGLWRFWFEDGSPKAEGKFLTGIPDGRWVQLYPNGQTEKIIEYRLGIRHGRYVAGFPNGQEQVAGRMDQGLKTGLWRFWYPNGQVKAEGHYLDGREEGAWRFWTKDGKLAGRYLYRAGKRIGRFRPPARLKKPPPIIPGAERRIIPPKLFTEDGLEIESREQTGFP